MKNEAKKNGKDQTKTPKAKTPKPQKPADRLPETVEELKASKSGLVSFLFLSGKDKEEIAKELKTAFKLGDVQAVKIVRRITGRARFFKRVVDLMAVK